MNSKEKTLSGLRAYNPDDKTLVKNLDHVWNIIEKSDSNHTNIELLLYNEEKVISPLRNDDRYFTENCKALLSENLILVNEKFLIEMEGAIQAFEMGESLDGSPYVKRDDDLFRLIDSIRSDPYNYVSRMRKLTKNEPEKEERICNITSMTYLFFIGHEAGHLLGKIDEQNFGSFVKEGDPLEDKVINSVVKLRRHAEEFKKYHFGLPGFERALKEGDEIEKSSAKLQSLIKNQDEKHERWYQNEIQADKYGVNILLDHISSKSSDYDANDCMYYIVRGVFAIAMYSWHKDLRIFVNELGHEGHFNTQSFAVAMMKDRNQYVRAATLFGDTHRFTLLRAERLIVSVIMARSNIFDKDRKMPGTLKGDPSQSGSKKLRQAVLRYNLICMLMDTAVKIAFMGTVTAWYQKQDLKRSFPQLFLMEFESIGKSMSRVMDLDKRLDIKL